MNITIREWRQSDAKSLAEVLSNPGILENLRDGIPYPYTECDALEYINAMISADKASTFAFAVCVDDVAVGSVSAFRRDNIHCRTAELGYYLDERYWKKGIMTEAVCLICKKIFSETDILRIFAEPFEFNIGSRRVLEKAGFSFEGTLKNNAFKNGKVLNMVVYALTKDE